MKITKQRLKEIIKEELNEIDLPPWGDDDPDDKTFGEYDLEAENEKGRQEESYVALVNYAADKMRELLELGHDVATAEEEAKRAVLLLASAALEEAAQIEL